MTESRKILIIKTGFSEFLDKGLSTTVSYGDVLLCTSLLNRYKQDHVTWVTSWHGRPLLEYNPFISELLVFGPALFKKLRQKRYDILINLEKDIGICAYLDQIIAPKRYGFYFDENTHNIASYKSSTRYLLSGQETHKDIHKTVLEMLFDTVGLKWKGEGLILARKNRQPQRYDIGFNYSVGTKWPTKAWPLQQWKVFERIVKKKYSISWQKGHTNLDEYINWIDSCRLIITSDSLGQAIGQALGKQVITLFGPTHHERMKGIKNIEVLRSPLKCPYMPCYSPFCTHNKFCMQYIEPQKVAQLCERLLS